MWCLCVGVVIGVLFLLGGCACVKLLIVYCDGQNSMGGLVLVCGCGDWRVGLLCVIAFSYGLSVVVDRT